MHKIAPWPKITKATHSLPSFFNSRTAVKNACVQRFFYVSMKVEQNIASDLLICVMLSANETLKTGFNTYIWPIIIIQKNCVLENLMHTKVFQEMLNFIVRFKVLLINTNNYPKSLVEPWTRKLKAQKHF
jgi:hypothetical protein